MPLGILGFRVTSCSTTSYTYRSSDISNQSIIANQAVVDIKLDIKKKIESISSKRNTPSEAMDEAYHKSITAKNIDIVVDPIFEVLTTDKIFSWAGKSTATSSALFPAKCE